MTRAPMTREELIARLKASHQRVLARSIAERHGEDISPPAPDELSGDLAWTAKTDDDEAAKAAREVTE